VRDLQLEIKVILGIVIAATALILIISLTSCLCVVPGVNAKLGCLPAGYNLTYTPPPETIIPPDEQEETKTGEEEYPAEMERK